MDIANAAEPQMVSCVIKDDQLVLVRRHTQAAADRLDEAHFALGRAPIDDATDEWKIDADSECRHIANHLNFAGTELAKCALALCVLGCKIDIGGRDARLGESLL